MEANKVPEKIYVVDATFPDYVDFDGSPINTKRIDDHDIEYTRTDAFIEMACVKLKKLMYDNLMFQGRLHREEVINNFVENFKKYMEGE